MNITVTSNEGARYGMYDASTGFWQVDIGSGPGGSDWPDGTSFTGSITYDDEDGDFSGTFSGEVNSGDPVTDVGLVLLDASPLTIDASADNTDIDVGQCINFSVTSSGGCKPYSYSWDFNTSDGIQDDSTDQNPTHCFDVEAYYECQVTVTDDCGNTDIDTIFITVGEPIKPPIADFSWNLIDCQTVSYTDSSSDPDGTIESYQWDFDDGTTSTKKNPTHDFAQPGTYSVYLEIIDNDNLSAVICKSVYIPISPSAGFSWVRTGDKTVDFSDLTSDTDDVISSYEWDFGDGMTSNEKSPSHQYDDYGDYQVTLTVETDYGCISIKSKTVSVPQPTLQITKPKIGFLYIGDDLNVPLGTDLTIVLNSVLPIRTSANHIDKVVFEIDGLFGYHYEHTDNSYPFTWDFDESLLLFSDELSAHGYIGNQKVVSDTIDDMIIFGQV